MLKSPLQIARQQYNPKLPESIINSVEVHSLKNKIVTNQESEIKSLFPCSYNLPLIEFKSSNITIAKNLNTAVVLSGGQAPGGHNVISGIFDRLKSINSKNKLYGFIGGPSGLINNKYIEITSELIENYRNTGGFDIIGSGRTKIEGENVFEKIAINCNLLDINSIIIIGGDDSNTNASILTEYFLKNNIDISVIGCPKTIDGDLKNEYIEASFGFDTATKVYCELIGNIQRDANSAKKYWHFIKLMGRSASHIALECALKTQPNITIISEEIAKHKLTLNQIVGQIAEVVKKRSYKGENFGTVLIPEGLIEFIPSINILISELNEILATKDEYHKLKNKSERRLFIIKNLSDESAKVYSDLPESFAKQLTLDRDPHGNVQVSKIETEKLLIDMVSDRLAKDKSFNGKFSAQNHFFGYEGRCAIPSNYDADYCYSLGHTAVLLLNSEKTGYMAYIKNTTLSSEDWIAGGVPFTMMLNIERRKGKNVPVIKKALVDLKGKPYLKFKENRKNWAYNTCYMYPGPIQYFGPNELCNLTTATLILEQIEEYELV